MLRRTFLGLPYTVKATIEVEELPFDEIIDLDGRQLSWYNFPLDGPPVDYDVLCWDVGSVFDNRGN